MSEPALNTMHASPPCTAWWGKLPSQGDFVGRRLPHALTMRWDEWLRNGMDQLRSDAAQDWSTRFVRSPLWFFLCPAAVLGQPMVGVIGPSSDRIGRLFPLAIMAMANDASGTPASDQDMERFLDGARNALIDARRLPLSPQQLDERLAALPSPFQQETPVADPFSLHSLLAGLDGGASAASTTHLPPLDWRACMGPESGTALWWRAAAGQAEGEVVRHEALHRGLFTRLFQGD